MIHVHVEVEKSIRTAVVKMLKINTLRGQFSRQKNVNNVFDDLINSETINKLLNMKLYI